MTTVIRQATAGDLGAICRLRIQRTNVQSMQQCWGVAGEATVTPDLARRVRDTDASVAMPQGAATMLDVARSALVLDDLSTVYRAQLFNLVSLPPGTANASPVAAELAQRADLGATFDSAWLRRDTVCLGCHNSEASVTDSDDPLIDRHWPAPGLPEKAVYGVSSAFLTEVIATFTFVIVILGVTSAKHTTAFDGLVIGLTLAALHFAFIPVSGNSLNPARSIGPALFTGGAAIGQLWLYIVAPMIGGAIAGVVAKTDVFEKD